MPSPEWRAIGRRLRECRLAAGLSQGDVAELLGCLQCHVSRYESGSACPLKRVRQWAAACDVRVGWVFDVLEGLDNPFEVATAVAVEK